MIAKLQPPYYAVIFTSIRRNKDEAYLSTNYFLEELAAGIEGFLGTESVRQYEENGTNFGISISYWRSLEAIEIWRTDMHHKMAKEKGIKEWYTHYSIRICEVKSENYFELGTP